MDQEELGELLSAYLDGELGGHDTKIVEELLRDNDEVQTQYESLRRTVSTVRSLPHHGPPPAMLEDLLAQLAKHDLLDDFDESKPEVPVRRFPWLPALSTAAVITAIALVGFQQRDWWSSSPALSPPVVQRERTTDLHSTRPDRAAVSKKHGVGTFTPAKSKRVRATTTDATPLDAKLAKGTTTDVVRTHSFVSEPVRLKLAMTDPQAVSAAIKRMRSHFSESHIMDVSATHGAILNLHSGAFFLEGKPGVNYRDDHTRRMLVHVPTAALDDLLDEVVSVSGNTTHVTLAAGSLNFDGLVNARDTLHRQGLGVGTRRMKNDSGRRAARRHAYRKARVASRTNRSGGLMERHSNDTTVADLFKTLGIPKAALNAPEKSPPVVPIPTDSVKTVVHATGDGASHVTPLHPTVGGKATARTNQPMTAGRAAAQKRRPAHDAPHAAVGIAETAPGSTRFVTLVLEFSFPSQTARSPREGSRRPSAKDNARRARKGTKPNPSR